MDQPSIASLIPHRPPFLFVDGIVTLEPKRIETCFKVPADAEFFKGHFPDNPVMPGVLLCECCFQSGALLAARRAAPATDGRTPVVTRINEAKFKQVVRPGDELAVEVELTEEVNDVFFMIGRLRTRDKLALRLSFAVTLAEEVKGR